MWCDEHKCTATEVSRREHNDTVVVIGECHIGNHIIVNKWTRIKSWTIVQPSKDVEANILVALRGGNNGSETVRENAGKS